MELEIEGRTPNKQIIYLLYNCNAWKSSQRLRCVSLSSDEFLKSIVRGIQDGSFMYGGCAEERELDTESQTETFRADWDELSREEINNKLKFGFLDITYSGEDL